MSFNPTFVPMSQLTIAREQFDRQITHCGNDISVIWESMNNTHLMLCLLVATTTERNKAYDNSQLFLRNYILDTTLRYYTRIHIHEYTVSDLLQLLPEFHHNHYAIWKFVRTLRVLLHTTCHDYLSSEMMSYFSRFIDNIDQVPTSHYVITGQYDGSRIVQSGTDLPLRRSVRLLSV
jgi:hypothetical protein